MLSLHVAEYIPLLLLYLYIEVMGVEMGLYGPA